MAKPRRPVDMRLPENAVEEPSWAIPAVVFAIVGILSLGFIVYYFAPSLGEILGRTPRPSDETKPVEVIVGGTRFLVPANYTRFAYARRGGIFDRVELYALLPDLAPYTPARANEFQDNSAESRVIFFQIETGAEAMTEADRYRKVYRRLITDPQGRRGPHGLRRYDFDPATGYKDEELLVREESDGTLMVLRCFKELPTIPSPNCRRDLKLSDKLVLSYRFQRAELGNWRDIDRGLRTLIRSFEVAPKAN